MRCLTLAEELRRRGVACRFICREHGGNLIHLIEARGFPVARLAAENHCASQVDEPVLAHADWLGAHWTQDAAETIESIAGEIPDWLVVDHYAIDARWESQLKPYCHRLMVIDDLADRSHDCDLLLDQNMVENSTSRYMPLVPHSCRQATGSRYAIISADYYLARKNRNRRNGDSERILVYFGANDRHKMTLKTVRALISLSNRWQIVDVVVGQLSDDVPELSEISRINQRIQIHRNLPTLCELMRVSDVFVGAAGTTTWERCCLGLPSIVFTVAANQVGIAQELARKGLIIYGGDGVSASSEGITNTLKESLDQQGLLSLAEKSMSSVDGLGALYTSLLMGSIGAESVTTRCATEHDEEFLLELANDAETRRQSFSSERITEECHRKWFMGRISDTSNCRVFIVQIGVYDIGQVRFDRVGEYWEIDYSLLRHVRGYRLAGPALSLAIKAATVDLGAKQFKAKVKSTNDASQKVFRRLGFVEATESGVSIFQCCVS